MTQFTFINKGDFFAPKVRMKCHSLFYDGLELVNPTYDFLVSNADSIYGDFEGQIVIDNSTDRIKYKKPIGAKVVVREIARLSEFVIIEPTESK